MTDKSGIFSFRLAPRPRLAAKEYSSPLLTLLRFVYLEVVQHVRKARWWCIFPISSMLAYIMISGVLVSASQQALQANIWDALFTMFGNPYLVFYLLTPFYLYLMSDLVSDSWFSEAMVLRLRSRHWWWVGKVLMLGILTAIYLVLFIGVSGAVVSFVLPWTSQWSQYTLRHPADVYVPSVVLAWSPLSAFSLLVLLLALGLFCVGLAVLVGGRLCGSAKWGFAAGLLINISSMVVLHSFIPVHYTNMFINNHLLFGSHAFGDNTSPYPSLTLSLIYWLVWIVVLFPAGWWLHGRHDFLRHE